MGSFAPLHPLTEPLIHLGKCNCRHPGSASVVDGRSSVAGHPRTNRSTCVGKTGIGDAANAAARRDGWTKNRCELSRLAKPWRHCCEPVRVKSGRMSGDAGRGQHLQISDRFARGKKAGHASARPMAFATAHSTDLEWFSYLTVPTAKFAEAVSFLHRQLAIHR